MFITVGAGFFAERHIRITLNRKLKTAPLTSPRPLNGLNPRSKNTKELKDDLRDSEKKLKGLVERSLAGIYLIQDGKFGNANPRFAEIIGYSVEVLTGKMGPADVVVPEDIPILEKNIRKRITREADSVHYVLKGLRKSGEVITMEIFGSRMASKGKPAIIGTLLDITKSRRMEEDLRRRLDELERFMRETTKREFRIAELKDRVKRLEQELREKTERPS